MFVVLNVFIEDISVLLPRLFQEFEPYHALELLAIGITPNETCLHKLDFFLGLAIDVFISEDFVLADEL